MFRDIIAKVDSWPYTLLPFWKVEVYDTDEEADNFHVFFIRLLCIVHLLKQKINDKLSVWNILYIAFVRDLFGLK